MFVAEFVLVADDFIGEWLNTPRGWKWRSFTKVTLPIVALRNSSYDELVASIKQSGDIDCASSNVVISYLIHLTKKVNPTIINNDARMSLYIMDVDANGFRPILRINIVDMSFEGPMNLSPSPPQCWTVNNNLNNYESDGDHPMNMEDDCVHMEDVSSNSQDAEEDCRMGSQPAHSLSDETNFYHDKIFADKKQLKMLLDGAVVRQSFDYRMEKSCTKLLKAKYLSPDSNWLLRARKYKTSNKFHIYKYIGVHTCGVEHATCKHKKMSSSELIASLCKLKSIVEDEPDLCVSSDRHIIIANAFSRVYNRAHQGLCMRHLAENLCVNQHCGEHLYLFYAVEKVYSFYEFSENFEELKYNCPEVNLLERSYSCRKFDLVKIPCEHAMAALRAKYGDSVGYGNSIYEYSSPIYKAASYLLAYSETINVVPPEAEWNVPKELLNTKISPPPYDPKLGRKKVKCTKGVSEMFKSKRTNRCSICKKSGHKRTTCSMANKS
ncbi:hypothetical protein BC332_25569 [Capsicum chinense]|nr:hypothetical protein BC332_25569 [Capsicum chinense]